MVGLVLYFSSTSSVKAWLRPDELDEFLAVDVEVHVQVRVLPFEERRAARPQQLCRP